ncbi:MAG: hypothetical protein CEN92_51 [Candidatus Berkelbacteria bacterium Licking1014_96]|uniref:Transposase IS200-like domain-containing protein n=1 Tax=Candidatus Berkelbacteria bacterium Licking1014_96 TaxID=2017149 RepID=A0A554LHD9_9BACT|nr:MAG: hypothetical protein CEN92_51 [Candidatus Berkelbacteria bacterium Licking1014_96]
MQKPRNFVNGNYYHLYNRGVAKQNIFRCRRDYQSLLNRFAYYLDSKVKPPISRLTRKELEKELSTQVKSPLIKIIQYCLMPNHFHLFIQQLEDNGIDLFIRIALDSYSRYFNTKHERVGPVFQGKFKSVEVEDNDQCMHLSRYIHLNPCVANIANKPEDYEWSSYQSFSQKNKSRVCNPKLILDYFKSSKDYQNFVNDYRDYMISLESVGDLILD